MICNMPAASDSETSIGTGGWEPESSPPTPLSESETETESQPEIYTPKEVYLKEFEIAIWDEQRRRTKALEDAVAAMAKKNVGGDDEGQWLGWRRCRRKKSDRNWEMAESMCDKMVEDLGKNVHAAIELFQKYKPQQVQCHYPGELGGKQLDSSSTLDESMVDTAECDRTVDELGKNTNDLLQSYKRKRHELEMRRKKQCEEASVNHFFLEFSESEMESATNGFSRRLKLVKGHSRKVHGAYLRGIYRAYLRNKRVFIRRFKPCNDQKCLEFETEVDVLSELCHPNLATPIGACMEDPSLVYEDHLPLRTLEDRLDCKDNACPLTWKARMRIASEICSALVFLHSYPPDGIIHGNLNPTTILIDDKDVCKLIDYGISSFLKLNSGTGAKYFDLKVTVYKDRHLGPRATTWSDMYSFGMVLLRLLSGKPSNVIHRDILRAVKAGKLEGVLDPTAGNWPLMKVRELAQLVLRCCGSEERSKPSEVALEMSTLLESLKDSSSIGVVPEVKSENI